MLIPIGCESRPILASHGFRNANQLIGAPIPGPEQSGFDHSSQGDAAAPLRPTVSDVTSSAKPAAKPATRSQIIASLMIIVHPVALPPACRIPRHPATAALMKL